MAVPVSYPGVYIDEFAPGAPIQGVGTSTAAFIGTASSGPIEQPKLIQSWDAFKAIFGDIITTPPHSNLAKAVYGFFQNGGTACYIVRAGNGQMAHRDLDARTGNDPLLKVTAIQEGPSGNAISVQVSDSSMLKTKLKIASSKTQTFQAAQGSATITGVSGDRKTLTVNDSKDFRNGDNVLIEKDQEKAQATIQTIPNATTINLDAPIAGAVDFDGGSVTVADYAAGSTKMRFALPDGAPALGDTFPDGKAVRISQGDAEEVKTVASTTADTITFAAALTNAFKMSDPANLPKVVIDYGSILKAAQGSATIAGLSADRKSLTVDKTDDFRVGDNILLKKDGDTFQATVQALPDATTVKLEQAIAGVVDYSGGNIRINDYAAGSTKMRLQLPAGGLALAGALPPGTSIRIKRDNEEFKTITSTTAETISFTPPLTNPLPMNDVAKLPEVASLEFDLIISDATTSESQPFIELSMNANHPNYWGAKVESEIVSIEEPESPPKPLPDDPRPKVDVYPLAEGTADNRTTALTDIRNNAKKYLDLLKPIDRVSLVAIPGETQKEVQQRIVEHCEEMYDRFAILDPEPGATPGNGIMDQFGNVRSERGFAALYYPQIVVQNPANGKNETWPPSGHIAGIYARIDSKRGVHKAPANTNILGASGLERLLSNEEQGLLNLEGINVLRVFPERGQPLIWGARTTATDRNWQYINIRRLLLYLEESIEKGINWAVFEPNNLQLWQKLKRTITDFLTGVWRTGALFGEKAEKAFYVRIDEALNPASEQALGRLYIEIGLKPTYPAEFIIVRIGIWRDGSEVTES
ncbi:phage tail sheath family protein [Candidatus Zixiibacteriota bacterium]